MPKYQKLPIVIEAELFHSDGNIPKGVYPQFKDMRNTPYLIDTLEGTLTVSPGDYVITGINGEKYPCKPDIFEKTYVRVEY